MNGIELVFSLSAAALSGGGLAAIVVKYMSRDVDKAQAAKIQAEAKQTAQQTAAGEVETIREILAEVRASEARKDERIDSLERRLDLLEERERHMLTRAAVHEAWDQLAFQALVLQDPRFPPPPPLKLSAELEQERQDSQARDRD